MLIVKVSPVKHIIACGYACAAILLFEISGSAINQEYDRTIVQRADVKAGYSVSMTG